MQNNRGYQQGDVLLFVADGIPADAKRVAPQDGRYILAHGESGHAHAVAEAEGIEMYERNGMLYLSVASEAQVVHEEHHAQTLMPGVYEIGKVLEVDPFTEEIRAVRD